MWNDKPCVWCGKPHSRTHSAPGGLKSKTRTCSKECAALLKASVHKRMTTCAVCGGDKERSTSRTCSATCLATAMAARGKPKSGQHGLCWFTAITQDDYDGMLSILHRKGYEKSEDIKEKWTYCTEGFPDIRWRDIVSRGVVLPRATRSGKEQQRHEDGVQ